MIMNRVRVVALILFVAQMVFLLFIGIVAGLRQKWFVMFIFFFVTVLFVIFLMSALMALKIESCFKRTEEFIFRKSDAVRSIMKASNLKGIHKVNKLIEKYISILSHISTPVFLSLGVFVAIFRQNWFWMGILLFVCIINHIIFREVLMILKIDACSKRLEELISKDKGDRASKEQFGE